MKIVRSQIVHRHPDEVFRWIEDPELARQWQPGIVDYRVVHETPEKVGTRFVEYMRSSDGVMEMRGTVVAYEPGRSIAFALSGGGVRVGTLFAVSPNEDGGAEVTVVVEQRIPGLLAVLLSPILSRRIGHEVERELDMLREACEGEGRSSEEGS